MTFKKFLILWSTLTLSSGQFGYKGGFAPIGPSDPQKAADYPELRSQLYQGDILLPDSRNAIKIKTYMWKGGIVPYRIAEGHFQENELQMIEQAIKTIENGTCVRFVPHKNQIEHIEFQNQAKKGCFAMIGRRPGKKEALPINLQSPECFTHVGTIEHELLHVVGILHEQARSDRDNFVTVHWSNIDPSYWTQFAKGRDKEITAFGLPYDYKSIMHYPSWAFSKNGRATITAKKDPTMELGQRVGPTDIDFKKVNNMYNCHQKNHL